MQYLKIAGLTIAVEGRRLSDNFLAFEADCGGEIDARARLRWEEPPPPPEGEAESRPLSWVYGYGDTTHYRYDDDSMLQGEVYDTLKGEYTLYANREHWSAALGSEEILENSMSLMLKHGVIEQLSLRDGLILHSVGIEYKGRAIAFSARAQTGKSTHSIMWVEHLGARVIDGDNCALRINGGEPVLYGLPWCGTSGLFENASAPLEAIVFLEQAEENEIVELDPVQKALRLTARCYMPHWAGYKAVSRCMDIAERLSADTRICLLKCRPDLAAMELVREWIEKRA